jgi:uncharacterized membrane protein
MRTRTHIHLPRSVGERAADAVVAAMGSWRFIIVQTIIVMCWIALNIVAIALRFDPYPFILLNLLFSTQAAYASPLILMAANRAAQRDRARDDHEAAEVDEMAALLSTIHEINVNQSLILEELRAARAARE